MLLFAAGYLIGVGLEGSVALPLHPADPNALWTAAGAVLVTAGLLLFAWGLWTFARAHTGIMLQQAATRVVTHGPYRRTRNPMYVGSVIAYVGASLVINSLWPVLLLPAVVQLLTEFIIWREERYMRAMFGPTYDAYCERVPRWL
jgi:protein-S-isoprenylcysteine O-methyltransferase Ste14